MTESKRVQPREELSAEVVRKYAEQYGIDISKGKAEAIIDDVGGAVDSLQKGTDGTQVSNGAKDITEANDEYNALVFRFRLSGQDTGILKGLQVGVKANISVVGVPLTCGSKTLHHVPNRSATVVRRLSNEGAEVVANTNMDEFALFTTGETSTHGRTINPSVPGHVPGGSSSGSAAAVAGDLLDGALGTDTGGSVRIPASFTGVFGLKPTYGSVSRYGFADLAPSFDTIGPIANSLETVAKMHDAVAGFDPADPSTYGVTQNSRATAGLGKQLTEIRLGVIEEAMDTAADGVSDTISDHIDTVPSDKVTVDWISIPEFDLITDAHVAITGIEFSELMYNNGQIIGPGTGYSESWRRAISELRQNDGFGDRVRDQLVMNRALNEATQGKHYTKAQEIRAEFTARVQNLLQRFDALILPTTRMVAPEFGEIEDSEQVRETTANTAPFSMTGNPALSIPAGEAGGKPVGLQVVTNWNKEDLAIAIGEQLATENQ